MYVDTCAVQGFDQDQRDSKATGRLTLASLTSRASAEGQDGDHTRGAVTRETGLDNRPSYAIGNTLE